jgi:hypothetical protein
VSPQKKEKVKKIIIFWTRQSFYQKRVLLVVVELLSKFAACDDFTRDDDDDDDDAIIVGTLEQQDHPQDEEKEKASARGETKSAARFVESRGEKRRRIPAGGLATVVGERNRVRCGNEMREMRGKGGAIGALRTRRASSILFARDEYGESARDDAGQDGGRGNRFYGL